MTSEQRNSNASSEELRQEVSQILNKLEHDIDNLEAQLTLGQLLDKVIYMHTQKDHPLPGETIHRLKENPVGASFLGIGALLLMEDSQHHTGEEKVEEKFREIKVESKEKLQATKAKIQAKTEKAKSTLEASKDKFQHTVEDSKGQVQEQLGESKQKVKQAWSQVPHHLSDIHPYTISLLGFGMGIALGGSIPLSQTEAAKSGELTSEAHSFKDELTKTALASAERVKDKLVDELHNVHFDKNKKVGS